MPVMSDQTPNRHRSRFRTLFTVAFTLALVAFFAWRITSVQRMFNAVREAQSQEIELLHGPNPRKAADQFPT